ncbi:MAG: hypothetical protein FWE57_07190 [Chitinispirillia bacterium]|nr:hypothetical protein [Chitinispirillia bacterium]
MKRLFVLIIPLIFSCSHTESFWPIDVKEFNEKIAGRTDIKTSEELIWLYDEYPQSQEGFRKRSVQTVAVNHEEYKITLIQEGLADDSMFGVKIVMTAKQTGTVWAVTEIKENWRCRKGRGQRNWGIEKCN